jgi:hypothetical protein
MTNQVGNFIYLTIDPYDPLNSECVSNIENTLKFNAEEYAKAFRPGMEFDITFNPYYGGFKDVIYTASWKSR